MNDYLTAFCSTPTRGNFYLDGLVLIVIYIFLLLALLSPIWITCSLMSCK